MAGAFLRFQWPHGPFVSQTGQLDGTGQALWAFEQVRAPARAAARSLALRDRVGQGVGVSSSGSARWRARPAAARIRGLPPATDPRDNELIHAQIVGNDAWALAGYRATARLLEAAGMEAEGEAGRAIARGLSPDVPVTRSRACPTPTSLPPGSPAESTGGT